MKTYWIRFTAFLINLLLKPLHWLQVKAGQRKMVYYTIEGGIEDKAASDSNGLCYRVSAKVRDENLFASFKITLATFMVYSKPEQQLELIKKEVFQQLNGTLVKQYRTAHPYDGFVSVNKALDGKLFHEDNTSFSLVEPNKLQA